MTMTNKKVLLIEPPGTIKLYSASKIKAAIPVVPSISLATLAGALLKKGYKDTKILDLNISKNPDKAIQRVMNAYKPNFVGITFVTPLFASARKICKKIKKNYPDVIIIGGGVHSTILPRETLEKGQFDVVVIGEGEQTLVELVGGKEWGDIKGIAYKKDGKVFINPPRPLIENLDDLPFPAWHLYDVPRYFSSYLNSRKNPVGPIETSRGCPFNCCFCNKTIFGRRFRVKSAERVVDEIVRMLELGFKEIHIWDDNFSADMERAKSICDLIIKKRLKFPWNIFNGLRVDRIDEELVLKLKKAGCYRTSIGIESGNQEVLNQVGKDITLEQVRKAVSLLKKAKIECLGYFILGLPGETEKTMEDTINFAKELKLDFIKAGIISPLPGTILFEKWEKEGRILSHNWSDYIFHARGKLTYNHPNLSSEIIRKYYNKFYRKFYLNPYFILNRFFKGIKNGRIFKDIYYFLKMILSGQF